MNMNCSIAMAAACLTFAAHAQTTIYRCGNAYSAQACEGATTIEAAPAAKAADVEASRRETERELKIATAMEKARLAEEANAPHAFIPKEEAKAPANDDKVITARKKKPQKPKKVKKAAA